MRSRALRPNRRWIGVAAVGLVLGGCLIYAAFGPRSEAPPPDREGGSTARSGSVDEGVPLAGMPRSAHVSGSPVAPETTPRPVAAVADLTPSSASGTPSAGVEAWVAAALQVRDPADRSRALSEIRAALSSGERARVVAGLEATRRLFRVPEAGPLLRPEVLRLLRSEDGAIRAWALLALPSLGLADDDWTLAVAAVGDKDPTVQRFVGEALFLYSKGKIERETSDAFRGLLRDPQSAEFRQNLSALRDSQVDEPMEAALLSLAKSGDVRVPVFEVLASLHQKSPAVVRVLVAALDDGDVSVRRAAESGMVYSFAPEARGIVADALARIAETTDSARSRERALDGLRSWADAGQLDAIDRVAQNPMLDQHAREQAARTGVLVRERLQRGAAAGH